MAKHTRPSIAANFFNFRCWGPRARLYHTSQIELDRRSCVCCAHAHRNHQTHVATEPMASVNYETASTQSSESIRKRGANSVLLLFNSRSAKKRIRKSNSSVTSFVRLHCHRSPDRVDVRVANRNPEKKIE